MTTPLSLLQELQSFVSVDNSIMEKAKKSKVNDKNNSVFRTLVNDWADGLYDEDPDLLVNDIGYYALK